MQPLTANEEMAKRAFDPIDIELHGYDIFCPDVGGVCKQHPKKCVACVLYEATQMPGGIDYVQYWCTKYEKELTAAVDRDGKRVVFREGGVEG